MFGETSAPAEFPAPGFLFEQGHRDHYLPIIYFMPAIFTLHTKGWEQIYHVVPAKLNLVPPSQILNKNPAALQNTFPKRSLMTGFAIDPQTRSWHFSFYPSTRILVAVEIGRAANNGRSTDSVRSKLGIDGTNPWIAGHLVRSFTNSFREILIFNYLISTRDNIHVSEKRQKRI